MIDRIQARLDRWQRKAPTPLQRLYPALQRREHVSSSWGAVEGSLAVDGYVPGAEVYRVYAWVRRAVSVRAETPAALPLRVVDADGQMVAHELNALFAQPNAAMAASQLWQEAFIHEALAGEWALEVVPDGRGRPRELWPRRPDHVTVIPAPDAGPYPIVGGYEVTGMAAPLPPEMLIHARLMNPLSAWRGLAPMTAVAIDAAIDLRAMAYARTFFANQARPDYAIESDQVLTQDERERLEAQLAERYGGGQAFKPLALETGQKIHVFSWPLKDLALLELREPAREAIGAVFGVPDEIMGFGRDTYENFETALRVFWMLCLVPMLRRRDDALTQHFTQALPLLKPGQRIATDVSGVTVLQEAIGPKLDNAQKLFAMGVPYNVAEKTLGLGTGPIPGGEIGYLPAGLLPIDQMGMPPEPIIAPAQRSVKGRDARRQAEAIARRIRAPRERLTAAAARQIDRAFDALAERVLDRLDGEKAVKSLPDVEQLLLPSDFDELRTIVRSLVIEVVRASWRTYNEALGVEIVFALSDPAVVAATRLLGTRITGITQVTRDAVRQALAYGTERGWSIADLVLGDDTQPGLLTLITQTYQGRAETIARTELATAQQLATTARFRGAGVSRVYVLDDEGPNSCAACEALNGSVQSLTWAEQNPLEHPNCVRAFGPLWEEP